MKQKTLKTYYKEEFIASTMSTETTNTNKLREFVDELKRLKVNVIRPDINNCFSDLSDEQKSHGWVTDALEEANEEAVHNVIKSKHGVDAVVFDPNDPEANKKAQADGRQVIYGGSYNSKVWDKIRSTSESTGSFKSSGSYSAFASPEFQGGAEELPLEKYTDGMKEVVEYTKKVHKELIGIDVEVSLHDGEGANASYNGRIPRISFFWKV